MYSVMDVPIQKLREYEENPRNNDIAVDKVKASIQRVGFMFPIVVDANYTIVAGHTRKVACAALGMKTVPCIMVDDLTEEQVDLFRLVDNKSSEYSSWDYERLAAELQMIDIEIGPNEFIIGAFDFDLAAHEFEDVPATVPIQTFNFMGDGFKKGKLRQAAAPSPDDEPEDDPEEDDSAAVPMEMEDDAPEGGEGGEKERVALPKDAVETGEAMVFGEQKKGISTVVHTFRCGDHRFIMSELEEERLTEAYMKYMSEVYPETTFIKYLLGGAEDAEI